MNLHLSKREVNRQRWLEHIRAWERSGLSQKAYCEQHHVGFASFQRWRRIAMEEEKPTNDSPLTFIPVNVTKPHSSCLTLRIKQDLRLEIPVDFDSGTLRQVIQILQTS